MFAASCKRGIINLADASASEANRFVLASLPFTQRLVSLALRRDHEERGAGKQQQNKRDASEAEREAELELSFEPVVALHAIVHVVQHLAEHQDTHQRRRRYVAIHSIASSQHNTVLEPQTDNQILRRFFVRRKFAEKNPDITIYDVIG